METLTATVIIEWENIVLSESGRSKAMLRQLTRQAHELRCTASAPRPKESFLARFQDPLAILVLYPEEKIDGAALRSLLGEILGQDNPDIQLCVLPAREMHYYELKNFGAHHATSDFIVFLDSDVIPEDDWLLRMLESFADPDVNVVGGNTYIDPYGLYAKATALFWFFPLREDSGPLRRTGKFFANSVAFRRQVFAKYPFPTIGGTTRGACTTLANQLTQIGVSIYQNPKAHVRHPPPNGLRHFLIRALADGRDANLWRSSPMNGSRHAGLRSALGYFAHQMTRSLSNIAKNHRRVNLSSVGALLAMCIATVYYTLALTGDVMTILCPGYMQKHFRI